MKLYVLQGFQVVYNITLWTSFSRHVGQLYIYNNYLNIWIYAMQCTFTYSAVIYRTMRIVLILVYHTTRAKCYVQCALYMTDNFN
jgi:hypothetical protein